MGEGYTPPPSAGGGGGGGAVSSVAGRTGDVVLAVTDVAGAAPTASPSFSGTVTLPSGLVLPASVVLPSTADISAKLGSSSATAAAGNDSRITGAAQKASNLSDLASAPTALANLGAAPSSGIAPSAVTGTAVVTADSRLSDARTPTAHKTSHATGGSDALTAADVGATTAVAALAAAKAASLDQFAAPAADVAWGSHKITGLANGSASSDAAAFGQIPASGAVSGVAKIMRRASDSSSLTSQATPQADDTLLWAVGANEVWFFMASLVLNAANATMDSLFAWSVPASATMLWGADGTPSSNASGYGLSTTGAVVNTITGAAGNLAAGSAAGTYGVGLRGVVVNSTTAGNVTLKWSQNTSDAGALIMKANSIILAWRIA